MVDQRWRCLNCGSCCRDTEVPITGEEARKIESQDWQAEPELAGRKLIVHRGGLLLRRSHALARRPDGACVFLTRDNLCRIHAAHGERAKPLACRLYPWFFVPVAGEIRLGVRFHCPAVARNEGNQEFEGQLRALCREVAPRGAAEPPAPLLKRGERLPWPDALQLLRAFEQIGLDESLPITRRLLKLASFCDLLEEAKTAKLRGERFAELVELLSGYAGKEKVGTRELSSFAKLHCRQLVSIYARKEGVSAEQRRVVGRVRSLMAGVRFARGVGEIPRLQPILPEADFEDIEEPFEPLGRDASEPLARYYAIKLGSCQYFGRAYYNWPILDGARALLLTFPVTLWVARWFAVGGGRRGLSREDVIHALMVVDHNYGYHPLLGAGREVRRVRVLATKGEIGHLAAWYAGGSL